MTLGLSGTHTIIRHEAWQGWLAQQRTFPTDWTTYYAKVPATARLTRRYTTRVLLDVMRRYVRPASSDSGVSIVEIGGANSCFLERILAAVSCQSYDVVDTNQYGLSLLANRAEGAGVVRLHNESVLGLSLDRQADLVFSVGLVGHFDPVQTREAVLAHLANVRPGGTTIITFPTPTLLYRMTRTLIESLGLWNFPAERPLAPREVIAALKERG